MRAALREAAAGATAARSASSGEWFLPPPGVQVSRPPGNLPQPLTSFVGREHELAEVRRLLASTRLVSLTGAGGCGKTRLGLQVAASLGADFPDGIWLVDLAALAEPALVPQAVAAALDVREEPTCSLVATLTIYLEPRRALLILDNCEHLVAACATLAAALLAACPTLRILATSREALGIAGEIAWRVPSLSLPDPERPLSVECLAEYEAIRLLVERASAVLPTFTLSDQNAAAVGQVARQLDGIPLALELAAARLKVLSIEQLAARLDDRFRLLTGGSRTALARQQTLRAAIDWSYDLLSESERALLQRLSVFAAGFTLDAAEAVASADGIEEVEVLDLLTQLVEKSLVVAEERTGQARYRLLESIRHYAGERLRGAAQTLEMYRGVAPPAASPVASLGRRHRDWYLALIEQAELSFRVPSRPCGSSAWSRSTRTSVPRWSGVGSSIPPDRNVACGWPGRSGCSGRFGAT
jgi:non-specific serine/threonine protein kinase